MDEKLKGRWAEQLNENPLLKEIIDDMIKQAFNDWVATSALDVDRREEIYRQMKAVERFRGGINQAIVYGRHSVDETE